MLPFRREIFQVGGFQINGRVKLLQVRLLRTFDLAVKVRASGLVGAEFYAALHKPPLNLFRENSIPRAVCFAFPAYASLDQPDQGLDRS